MPTFVGTSETPTPGPARKPGRRKLWDLPNTYRCPVIGTCLSVAELRRIAARYLPHADLAASDYDVHVRFVTAADDKNPLSLATQMTLDRRHQSDVKRFARARDPDSLLALWADAMARGEVPGAFWALMTHARSDQSVLAQAYKDVHMLSHQVGACERSSLRRLTETRAELETLKRDFDTLQTRTRRQADDREERLRQLERTPALREAELTRFVKRERDLIGRLAAAAAEGPAQRIAELELQLADLTDRLDLGEREIAGRRRAAEEAQRRACYLDLALSEKLAECAALERLLSDNLAEAQVEGLSESSADHPESEGPRYADLAGRLVLCVGGRLPHVREFNRLVTRCNGRFDHHDGGLEDGDHRLESLLACADAVVCATDFVSHSAYHRTKRYCKRHEKPHVLLQRSGLSAFARALATVAM